MLFCSDLNNQSSSKRIEYLEITGMWPVWKTPYIWSKNKKPMKMKLKIQMERDEYDTSLETGT